MSAAGHLQAHEWHMQFSAGFVFLPLPCKTYVHGICKEVCSRSSSLRAQNAQCAHFCNMQQPLVQFAQYFLSLGTKAGPCTQLSVDPGRSEMACAPIGGSNDEDSLLAVHAVHLCQQLIEHTVCCAASVSRAGPTLVGNGVQLIKEQHTWRALPGLVKYLPHVGL